MIVLENLLMLGPGRRSGRTVIDQLLEFEPADLDRVGRDAGATLERLRDHLRDCGLTFGDDRLEAGAETPDPAALLCRWYAELALSLQQSAGHRVAFASAEANTAPHTARAIFEYEEATVGSEAAELARELLMEALRAGSGAADPAAGSARIESFRAMARELILPLDSEVLIEAAKTFDVPCFKLDREPYAGLQGEFRIRQNGLLMFGHACHQRIVDGTVSVDRSAEILTTSRHRLQVRKLLQAHGLPVPRTDPLAETFVSLSRARRSAHRLGYPVVVKPLAARKGAVSCNIASDEELARAVRQAQGADPHFLIESHIPGQSYRMLYSGQQFLAVVDARDGSDLTDLCDATIIESATGLAGQLPAGMLVLSFVTTDPGRPLAETGGAFVGLNVAPEVESMVPPGSELHRAMAEGFVEWLIPAGQPCRVPVFSVTGTNGKTTTCRMLSAIMKRAGFRVGMACTDGVYLNGRQAEKGDMSGRNGHHRVFESRDIDLAVLETARGAVLTSGFIFDRSDVAVCTNVTPEHLGEYGIETVEEMGEVKQLVLERAQKAIVLNADDEQCRQIAQRLTGRRVSWCSLESSLEVLQREDLQSGRFLVLESRDGKDWIVDHHAGSGSDLIAAADIPAAFGGIARHNLLNAMQAMAAALEFGIDVRTVREAMAGFSMGIETTPGRSNFYHGLGFPVLMDFVQTIDGMRRFCEFVRGLNVDGRRILVISVLGRHDDETIRGFARHAASAFDHFVCRNYGFTFKRPPEEIPELLRDQLLKEGVPEGAITIILNDTEAMDFALGMAREGDLVAMMCGHEFQKYWQEIASFPERAAQAAAVHAAPATVETAGREN